MYLIPLICIFKNSENGKFGKFHVMYILLQAHKSCPSEESSIGQEWTYSGTLAELSHWLRASQRKHGHVDAVMGLKEGQLCSLQQFSQREI